MHDVESHFYDVVQELTRLVELGRKINKVTHQQQRKHNDAIVSAILHRVQAQIIAERLELRDQFSSYFGELI